jgi:hypothetical protein
MDTIKDSFSKSATNRGIILIPKYLDESTSKFSSFSEIKIGG